MKKLDYLIAIIFVLFVISACDKRDSGLNNLQLNQDRSNPTMIYGAPCSEETAWAGCNFYNGGWANLEQGNWARYTEYTYPNKYLELFAGQNMVVGSVELIPYDDAHIIVKICLIEGWCLQNVSEPIKIQDYATAPEGNPKPGQFQWKSTPISGGPCYEVIVPLNRYYGIHVDVGCCGE